MVPRFQIFILITLSFLVFDTYALPLEKSKQTTSKSVTNGGKSCDRCEILGKMCQNGGKCVSEECTTKCECRDGFSGTYCEIKDSAPVRRKRKQFGSVIMSLFRTLGSKEDKAKEKDNSNGHHGETASNGDNGKHEENEKATNGASLNGGTESNHRDNGESQYLQTENGNEENDNTNVQNTKESNDIKSKGSKNTDENRSGTSGTGHDKTIESILEKDTWLQGEEQEKATQNNSQNVGGLNGVSIHDTNGSEQLNNVANITRVQSGVKNGSENNGNGTHTEGNTSKNINNTVPKEQIKASNLILVSTSKKLKENEIKGNNGTITEVQTSIDSQNVHERDIEKEKTENNVKRIETNTEGQAGGYGISNTSKNDSSTESRKKDVVPGNFESSKSDVKRDGNKKQENIKTIKEITVQKQKIENESKIDKTSSGNSSTNRKLAEKGMIEIPKPTTSTSSSPPSNNNDTEGNQNIRVSNNEKAQEQIFKESEVKQSSNKQGTSESKTNEKITETVKTKDLENRKINKNAIKSTASAGNISNIISETIQTTSALPDTTPHTVWGNDEMTSNHTEEDRNRWPASSLQSTSNVLKKNNMLEVKPEHDSSDISSKADISMRVITSKQVQGTQSKSTNTSMSKPATESSKIRTKSTEKDKTILNVIGILSKIIQTLKHRTSKSDNDSSTVPTKESPLVSSLFPFLPNERSQNKDPQNHGTETSTIATAKKLTTGTNGNIMEEKNSSKKDAKLAASVYDKFSPLVSGIKTGHVSDKVLTTPFTTDVLETSSLQDYLPNKTKIGQIHSKNISKNSGKSYSESVPGSTTSTSITNAAKNQTENLDQVYANDVKKMNLTQRSSAFQKHSKQDTLTNIEVRDISSIAIETKNNRQKHGSDSVVTLKINSTIQKNEIETKRLSNQADKQLMDITNSSKSNIATVKFKESGAAADTKLGENVTNNSNILNKTNDVEIGLYSNETSIASVQTFDILPTVETKTAKIPIKPTIVLPLPITTTGKTPMSVTMTTTRTTRTTNTMTSKSQISTTSDVSPKTHWTTPLTTTTVSTEHSAASSAITDSTEKLLTTSKETFLIPSTTTTTTTTQHTTIIPTTKFLIEDNDKEGSPKESNTFINDVGPALLFKRLIEQEKEEANTSPTSESSLLLTEVKGSGTSERLENNIHGSSDLSKIIQHESTTDGDTTTQTNENDEQFLGNDNGLKVSGDITPLKSITGRSETSTIGVLKTSVTSNLDSKKHTSYQTLTTKTRHDKTETVKRKNMEDYNIPASHRFLQPGGNDLIDTTTTLKPYTLAYSGTTVASGDVVESPENVGSETIIGGQRDHSKIMNDAKDSVDSIRESTTENLLFVTEQSQKKLSKPNLPN